MMSGLVVQWGNPYAGYKDKTNNCLLCSLPRLKKNFPQPSIALD